MRYLILLTLIACHQHNDVASDKTFKPYKSKFYQDAASYDVSAYEVPINFGNVDALGICDQKRREVQINKTVWDKLTETQREVLIYHELGHCALDRDHYDESPSIMNEDYLFTINQYEKNESKFLDELFLNREVIL